MGLQRKLGDVIEVTPVIDTAAYATADHLGAVQVLTNALQDRGHTANLTSVSIVDNDSQNLEMDLLFFGGVVVPTSADNAAADVSDAQLTGQKYLGHVSVVAADYIALANGSVASVRNLDLKLEGLKNADATPNDKNITVFAIARGAATYLTTTSLKFLYGLEKD